MSVTTQPLTTEDSALFPWWWRTVLIVMVLDFACLITTTSLAYRNAPPLPAQVLDSHDVIRLRQAAPSGAVSEQVVQNAEDQIMALEAEMREAEAELNAIEAKVGGTIEFCTRMQKQPSINSLPPILNTRGSKSMRPF